MKLGILGGGQLARMLTLAAYPLGIKTLCLDPNPQACTGGITDLIVANFTDESALTIFLQAVDCVTLETENIPLACAEFVAQQRNFYPSPKALAITQDRLLEKSFLNSLDIPTAEFKNISSQQELLDALTTFSFPAILKTRRMGYDGKGQWLLKSLADSNSVWEKAQGQDLILEKWVPFEYELSLIAVRNINNELQFYPLTRNQHHNGILFSSEAPFVNKDLQQQAENYAEKIFSALSYIGVIAIEFFYDGKKLLVNEIAPRVHNSGHWTIEGADTSQFENHLRALFGLPLGCTKTRGHVLMLNCISKMAPLIASLQIPGAHYHDYGKSAQPGRKLGHVTLVETDIKRYEDSKQRLLELWQKVSSE